jgi:hypothetical protein
LDSGILHDTEALRHDFLIALITICSTTGCGTNSNPMSNYTSRKNLTRFTYENSAFLGWRLYITRKGKSFVKYFSDRQYGSAKESLAAAEAALDELKDVLGKAKLIDGTFSENTVSKGLKIIAPKKAVKVEKSPKSTKSAKSGKGKK